MKTYAEIYETLRLGDPLTDSELVRGIEFFGDLASKASLVGPAYSLMARDARMTASTLNDFYAARVRNRKPV